MNALNNELYNKIYSVSGFTPLRLIVMLFMFLIIILFLWLMFSGGNINLGIRKSKSRSVYDEVNEYYLITTQSKVLIKNLLVFWLKNMLLSMVPVWYLYYFCVLKPNQKVIFNFSSKVYIPWKTYGYSIPLLVMILIVLFIITVSYSVAVNMKFLWFLQHLIMTIFQETNK
jgi:hypothetical protein